MNAFLPGSRGQTEARPSSETEARTSFPAVRRVARSDRGSQLVEFAMALPLLLLMLAGVLDMALAFNIKQKLTNAAREGARLGASQNMIGLTDSSPASITTIHDTVVAYLNQAHVDTSFIGSSMASGGAFTWTYYSSGTTGLKIERTWPVPSDAGAVVVSTRITLTYPYNWTFGFNRVLGTDSGTVLVTTQSLMPNLQ